MILSDISVVLFTDRDLTNHGKGNVMRLLGIISALQDGGASVHVVAPVPRYGPLQTPHTLVHGPRFQGGDPTALDLTTYKEALRGLSWMPDIAIAAYAWMAPCLSVFPPQTLCIVDTHDVLSQRTQLFHTSGLDPWVRCDEIIEATLLQYADLLLAIRQEDIEVFQRLLPRGPAVHWLPHVLPAPCPASPSAGYDLLFVGSEHDGNLGIREFIQHSLPKIRATFPEATLTVVGDIASKLDSAEGLLRVGRVDQLTDLYAHCALVIAPVQLGTGLKIKSVEALAATRVLVALPEALAGFPSVQDPPWQCCNDLETLTTCVMKLLSNPALRHQIESRGPNYVSSWFSLEVAQNLFRSQLCLKRADVSQSCIQ